MEDSDPDPLAELARELQQRSQRFQGDLTEVCRQVGTDPAAAAAQFEQCLLRADALEREELAFLAQMGEWGAQQVPQAKTSWQDVRVQIWLGKAQAFQVLGQYSEAQTAIDRSRSYVTDEEHPAHRLLDQLEILLMQARG